MAELLECFTSEKMNASKVVDQFVFELLPAVDVDECALLVKGHGLEHPLGLGCVVPFGTCIFVRLVELSPRRCCPSC